LTGNADILLESERLMDRTCPARNLIEEAAAYAEAPAATPGLMLGQAGVGYFLLRVANPTVVPTALLIAPGWLKT
jgi:lantibiotic modifying enzyme